MLGNIWADIQNYFSDWLSRTGGDGAYTTFTIDLSVAHSEEKYDFSGDQIIITDCDDKAYIKLNDKRNDFINVQKVRQIHTPFNEFFITNEVGVGELKILCGTKGIFQSASMSVVDIFGQSMDRIVIRDHEGIAESSSELTQTCPHAGYTAIKSDTGKGILRCALFRAWAMNDSEDIEPRIKIDGSILRPEFKFVEMDAYGFDTSTRPLSLLKYAINGVNVAMYNFDKGVLFDDSIEFGVYNFSPVTDMVMDLYYFYQKLP